MSLSAQSVVHRELLAPGIRYIRVSTPAPQVINVLEIDCPGKNYFLEAYRPSGLVRTSIQTKDNSRPAHRVLAAINADFFSLERLTPIGNQVSNGAFVSGVESKRSHVAILNENRPSFEQLSFSGVCFIAKDTIRIAGVNTTRQSGESVLYNSYWGPVTQGDSTGVTLTLGLLNGTWHVADTLMAIVLEQSGPGTTALREGEAVLASPSTWGSRPGDTVRLFLGFETHAWPFLQVLGGAGRILDKGKISWQTNIGSEGLKEKFLTDRHPRTFAAINRDTTRLFLCTVDGRQKASVGMNFQEMGDFLLSIGAWNAINLDGGGSTTMVVRNRVVNTPSDSSGERAVANTLQVIVPEDSEERR